jgi:Dolichyl-phosphate-mannose-protein mannosyltransferase
MASRLDSARDRLVPLGVLLVLATVFRLPALVNAGAINSDAAVVALQARHMLHGELAWHLWGTDYQGSADSLLAALSFAVFGARPLALFAVPFVGLLVMVSLAFDLLRRHVGPWAAAFSVMPLVFAPMASNLPMVYVMRQTLATTLVLGVWLVGSATRSARPRLRLVLAGGLFAFALYIDVFAIVTLPAALLFLISTAVDPKNPPAIAPATLRRAGVGLALAGAALVTLALATGVVPVGRIAHNASLMRETCLPFALGTKVFIKGEELVAQPWSAPAPVAILQVLGATIFAVSLLAAGPLAFSKRIPWPVRTLGLLGFVTTIATLAAFLVSTKPVDMWSSRYLAPIFWLSPFTLAPLAWRLQARRLVLLHLPYWTTALLGGWLSYGLFVDGPRIRVDARTVASDERILQSELVKAGVHEAKADYWLAYRLTFLFDEDPLVVPVDPGGDRYPPYQRRVEAAPVYALLFHPSEPRSLPETYEAELRASGQAYERRDVAGFTVLLIHR